MPIRKFMYVLDIRKYLMILRKYSSLLFIKIEQILYKRNHLMSGTSAENILGKEVENLDVIRLAKHYW